MAVDVVEQGDSTVFLIQVPSNAFRFSATLCWNDAPASPNAAKALVNDLDLRVLAPDGAVYQPWVLNAAPNPDSLTMPARPGLDTLNNVEQVWIENPVAGEYRITVKGSRIAGAWQDYGIAFYWDTLQHFSWTSPLAGDPATAGEEATLRWESTFIGERGLSTLYRVDRVRLEKQAYDGSWTLLLEQSPDALLLEYTDIAPHPGINVYRAVALLDGGAAIESEQAVIYFTGPAGALVLPNPAKTGDGITVISRFVTGEPCFMLYDTFGRMALGTLRTPHSAFPTLVAFVGKTTLPGSSAGR